MYSILQVIFQKEIIHFVSLYKYVLYHEWQLGENGMPIQSHRGEYLVRLTNLLCNSFLSASLIVTFIHIFILANLKMTA